jgi:hypothetical protein
MTTFAFKTCVSFAMASLVAVGALALTGQAAAQESGFGQRGSAIRGSLFTTLPQSNSLTGLGLGQTNQQVTPQERKADILAILGTGNGQTLFSIPQQRQLPPPVPSVAPPPVIPLPAPAWLLLTGLAALIGLKWRA